MPHSLRHYGTVVRLYNRTKFRQVFRVEPDHYVGKRRVADSKAQHGHSDDGTTSGQRFPDPWSPCGRAVHCPDGWTVNNSKTEGKRMIRLHSKLALRGFNGECEGAIANVSWNNAERMEQRIRKAFADINKLNDVLQITITDLYFILKIEELRMTQEYEQKRYEIREGQRGVRDTAADFRPPDHQLASLQETDPSVYAWNPSTEELTPQGYAFNNSVSAPLMQQEGPAIGTDRAAVEPGHNLPSPIGLESETRLVTLCHSEGRSFFGANCCVEAQLCHEVRPFANFQ